MTSDCALFPSIAFLTAAGSRDGLDDLPLGAILSHQRQTPKQTTARIRIVSTAFPRPVIGFVPLIVRGFSAVQVARRRSAAQGRRHSAPGPSSFYIPGKGPRR